MSKCIYHILFRLLQEKDEEKNTRSGVNYRVQSVLDMDYEDETFDRVFLYLSTRTYRERGSRWKTCELSQSQSRCKSSGDVTGVKARWAFVDDRRLE